MGTLGKILLGVNLLAAVGVALVVSADWAARREVQANALRHQLILTGLPVAAPPDIAADDPAAVPLGVTTVGRYRVETVSAGFLADHFKGFDGPEVGTAGPVRTQLDELKAVKTKLDAKLGGTPLEVLDLLCGKFAADPGGRVTYAPGLLANLAQGFTEREVVRRLADRDALARNPDLVETNAKAARDLLDKAFAAASKIDPAAADQETARVKEATDGVNQAAETLKAKFAPYAAALAKSDAAAAEAAARDIDAAKAGLSAAQDKLQLVLADIGTAGSRDAGDQRLRIGHLLVHSGESEAWQKRVAVVTGLKTYLQVVADQATKLQRMATSVDQQVILDQAAFSEEYERLRVLATTRAYLLKRQTERRVNLQSELARDADAATARRLLLADRRAELSKLVADVTAELAAQAEVEQRLFDTQMRVGDALRATYTLEAELAAAEAK